MSQYRAIHSGISRLHQLSDYGAGEFLAEYADEIEHDFACPYRQTPGHCLAVMVDAHGAIDLVNQAMAAQFGKQPHELLGTCIWALYPAEVIQERWTAMMEVIRTGEMLRYLDVGTDGYFDTTLYPIPDLWGRVQKVAIVAIDAERLWPGLRLFDGLPLEADMPVVLGEPVLIA